MKKILQVLILTFVSGVLSAQIPTDHLVAWYPFNGNANDASGNGHNGIIVGAIPTTDRWGNANCAYAFDGYTGVERYISAHIGQHDTISFSVWFKSPYPTTYYPDILNYGTLNRLEINILGNNPIYVLGGTVGEIEAGADAGGSWSPNILSNEHVDDNIWHCAVACFVPYDNVYFYIDAQLIGIAGYTPNNPTDDLLYIGREINDNAAGGMHLTHFNGSIDDIRIYNKLLTPSEITAIFNESNGPIAYYPFNGNANDESGNGNNGTAFGATLTTDRNGVPNSAYQFNNNNYIELLHPLPIDSIFTIAFWTFNQILDTTILGTIINDGSIQYSGNDFLINMTSNRIGIRADKDNKPLNYEDYSPSQLTNIDISNKWVHVAWVMTPDTSIIYLNGLVIATINEKGTNTGYHDSSSYIGARNVWGIPDNFFIGKIDDINIYNRPLSPAEIWVLYNETTGIAPINNSNLVTVYPNPAKDYVFISIGNYSENSGFKIKIFDQLGQNLLEKKISGPVIDLDVSMLIKGIYLIIIENITGIETRKLIIW